MLLLKETTTRNYASEIECPILNLDSFDIVLEIFH
jgi:hypothetical protein